MSSDPPPYKPNDLVGSKYRLVKVLGEGGMSVVYDAVDISCERRAAVKVIRPAYAVSRNYSKERMRREAEVLVRLHEKTESVVDVLTAGITEDAHRLPYYVMERLRGDTLRQFIADQIERGVEFTVDEVTGIGIPVAMALAHAHALGIVHRDTKPDNTFMAVMRDGKIVVKVLDFGICADVDDAEAPGSFTGTLPYAAPEQLEGQRPLPATDVYALGLILFELLTLKLPHGRHRGDLTLERLAVAIMKKPVPDLASLRLDAPPTLVQLVTGCLAVQPDLRPQAHDVAKVLRDIKLSFLGELTGVTHSMSAATDVSGTPAAVLQAQLAEAAARRSQASDATHPSNVQIFAGERSADPKAATKPLAVTGVDSALPDDDEVFFRSSAEQTTEPQRSLSIPEPAMEEPERPMPVAFVGPSAKPPRPEASPDSFPPQASRQFAAVAAQPVRTPDRLAANQFVQSLVARHQDGIESESEGTRFHDPHARSITAGSLGGIGFGSDLGAVARPRNGRLHPVTLVTLATCIVGSVAVGVAAVGLHGLRHPAGPEPPATPAVALPQPPAITPSATAALPGTSASIPSALAPEPAQPTPSASPPQRPLKRPSQAQGTGDFWGEASLPRADSESYRGLNPKAGPSVSPPASSKGVAVRSPSERYDSDGFVMTFESPRATPSSAKAAPLPERSAAALPSTP